MEDITDLGILVARNVGALDEDLPDAVQDALLAVHLTVVTGQLEKHHYDTLGNNIQIVRENRTVYFPRSYFKTAVENRILDRHRARKRRIKIFGRSMPLEAVEAELLESIDTNHLTVTELLGRLYKLCATCRILIKLRFFDELTYQEICDELAPQFRNEAAVRRKLRDCLKRLSQP
ncbi:MAG: sigma-70 family RNA polymerase sigma factor [Planctomycetaceae bacterium]